MRLEMALALHGPGFDNSPNAPHTSHQTSSPSTTNSLNRAVAGCDVELVSRLLSTGVDPNVETVKGVTSLHVAVEKNCIEVVRILLAYGARVNARDTESWSPLDLAADMNRMEIAQLLISKGAEYDIFVAVALQKREMIAKMLEREPDLLAARGRYGRTPLHEAAALGLNEIGELLLDRGAEVNSKDKNDWTPLYSDGRSRNIETSAGKWRGNQRNG